MFAVGRKNRVLFPGCEGRTNLRAFLTEAGYPQGELALALQISRFDVESSSDDHFSIEILKLYVGQFVDERTVFRRPIAFDKSPVDRQQLKSCLGIRHETRLAVTTFVDGCRR
jgi:hypothetical protein